MSNINPSTQWNPFGGRPQLETHPTDTITETTILWSLIYGSDTIYIYYPTNRYWYRTRLQLLTFESNPKLKDISRHARIRYLQFSLTP